MTANYKRRLASLASDCHGYVDPGTGSYLLQMLLAGALGAGFAVRSFWAKIRASLSAGKRSKDVSDA
jgi:hypothetical protein